MQKVCQNVIAS